MPRPSIASLSLATSSSPSGASSARAAPLPVNGEPAVAAAVAARPAINFLRDTERVDLALVQCALDALRSRVEGAPAG